MKIIIHLVLLTLLIPVMSHGEEPLKHQGNKTAGGVEALSPGLRDLLSEEMQAIENGMMSVIPAYASGNWGEIETTAGKIKNSYILKQNLTESQVKELHAVLPHAFIEKDQRFHYLAGMLKHAAKAKQAELINFYFSEMNESCVSCHSRFAAHRFPAFSLKETTSGHSH